MIILRPHHLLCIQGFQGHGYSSTFVENLRSLIGRLKLNPYLKLKLIIGCDDICHFCPHCKNAVCQKDERVKVMDRKVLSKMGLSEKRIIMANRTFDEVRKFRPSDVLHICSNCQWKNVCTFWRKNAEVYRGNREEGSIRPRNFLR